MPEHDAPEVRAAGYCETAVRLREQRIVHVYVAIGFRENEMPIHDLRFYRPTQETYRSDFRIALELHSGQIQRGRSRFRQIKIPV